jgi:hypothetical protein
MSYTGLGATANYSKWTEMWAAQKNEARKLFGSTSVNLPGRTDIQYPNLTGDHAKKLMAYWDPQFAAVNTKVQDDAYQRNLTPAQYTAMPSRDAWNREYTAYRTTAVFTKGYALAWAKTNLPESMSVPLWRAMEPLVLRGSGIAGSPTPWTMLGEALAEQVHKVADVFTPSWWTYAKWGGIILGGMYVLQLVKGRDR